MVKVTATKQNIQKSNQKKNDEYTLRDLWDNIKCTNIHIIGVSEGEEREKGPEKIVEETMAENFLNMGKEIVKVHKAQRTPGKINPRRNTLRLIVIKLKKKN